MKYGVMGRFVHAAFGKTAYDYVGTQFPDLDIADCKRRVLGEYKAIVARTPSVGPMRKNMFVMTMYAGAFFIALYKSERERMTPEVIEGLIREVSYCPLMRKAKEGKSAFTEGMVESRTEQAAWSREHIDEYPMNWYWYFEAVPGKEEYYITHKQCGICKLCAQEGCVDIARYLCAMDYYTFEMQGAVLDRTKTLAYGDDECNFHLMSKARAAEIGFVESPDAK
ncbi:MAG: hypothetical protein E7Z99_03350 [Coriobacteriaceae bacterium]|nr:hypothetical protein [Coriobacteriaceae bacterium]